MLGRLSAAQLLLAATQIFARQAAETAQVQPAKCVLEGTAVDFTTAEPLRKTTIRLAPSSGPAPEYMGITDPSGDFHLEGIPERDYELTGERAGYLKSEFGARCPGGTGTILHLKAGAKVTDLTVKLVRCSVITGKVSDENGKPIAKALVYELTNGTTMILQSDIEQDFSLEQSLGADGKFHWNLLRPRKYRLYAFEDFDREAWGSPQFAALLALKSREFEMQEGEHLHVTVPLISAEDFQEALRETTF